MTEPESAPEDLSELKEDGDNFLEHGQIGTNHYFKFSDLPELRNAIALTVLAEAAARSGVASTWASVGVIVMNEVLARVRKLQPDEVVALHVLKTLAGGGSMYDVWVKEDVLVARLADEHLSEDSAANLLASMKSRGILEGGAGRWRAVR